MRLVEEFAFLDDGARRFEARVALPRPPATSAVVRLIQGIYECEPEHARRILRNRIHTTVRTPTEMCRGMVQVAAKRLSGGAEIIAPPEGILKTEVDVRTSSPMTAPPLVRESGEGWMSFALRLSEQVETAQERYLSDRRIAALLISSEDQLLGWAINSSSLNKTLHAEVKLVQGYCGQTGLPLPRGSRIYTTLKSCKMCAGMIWDAAEDPGKLEVIYACEDPGPKARSTVLTPDGFERRRACQSNPALLSLVVEKREDPL